MKNEQLIIYVLIAILYGAVGFLLYKKYETKEGCGTVLQTGNVFGGSGVSSVPSDYWDM